ncbi:hypothetical protein [Dysgonomonas sp.]|jgi:hypothetical protein|uniref:hypothetical protein n=1 Tax=Dysgonomonas sp. TaxID=1891233 RepID=UPI00281B01E3|nr:hypothetical protein [Dysgonomonas sp.]MDR2001684.1 hypothetical protein [Prevotella sp.]HMM04264.1 hypothetical protein [Dysgonomonas sp.]
MYIHINSEYLQLAEPLMAKYYDFHSTMLYDEIRHCVHISTVDYDKTFRENKDLTFIANVPYNTSIEEKFSTYFEILEDDDTDEEIITDDDIVYMSLTFMSYVYHKESKGLFKQSSLIADLDLEYQSILHKQIYPEMLSLYKIILESKTKKHRGSKITLTYKQDKIDINSCAWFLDDMERMFKERFPDLNLEKINQLLPDNKSKAGRKFNNRITNNLIWGTYQLLYNHHSRFKNSKTRISEEICQFIIDYLDCLEIPHDLILVNVRDWLKDMLKRGYTPIWDLPWRNAFSNIQEKQPETFVEKLNTPQRKNDLSNL